MCWRLCIEFGKFASRSKKVFAVVLLSALCIGVSAEAQSKTKPKPKIQNALVGQDGATVYAAPSFDAEIIDQLPTNASVKATLRRVEGTDGLGLFYKVKTKSGKIGYVADVELVPEYSIAGSKKKKPVRKKNEAFEVAKEKKENPNREPIFFTRYIGGGVGRLKFTEKFQGQKFSSDETMFAFKMTGPGTLFDGPPLDFNFSFSPTAPKYYENFGRGPAGGFFIFTDLFLNMPLYEPRNGMFFYGMGGMLVYTRFSPTVSSTTFDSQEIRIGAGLSVGYAHRFGKYSVRWDTKYYWEKTDYLGHWISAQMEYK